ncbi:MAG TPA: DNA recombination protein RmuC [Pseudomonadales bacterium]|nr:DNA recombination protein RmuC [Pseudomonadales bacterium]
MTEWGGVALGFAAGVLLAALWLRGRLSVLTQQKDLLMQQALLRDAELDDIRARLYESRELAAALQATLEGERSSSSKNLAMLQDAQQQLRQQFENLANRIFDDKQQRFREESKAMLEASLSPLRQQLGDFKQRVETVYENDSQGRQSLLAEVKLLQQLNQAMNEESRRLTRALKGDNKAQGNWGEIILERVLEQSGLTAGREYDTQLSLHNSEGKTLRPDVLIRLPDNRCLIVDAKVSLTDYERFINAEEDDVRERALKQHVASMRQHIASLSQKDYEFLEGVTAPEFVFVFVPIEAAYHAVVDADPSVFTQAYEKNVVVVSPATLLATLRTVQFLWRRDKQNRNAEKIASEAGGLYDQLSLVLESLLELGKQVQRTQDSYETTLKRLTEGRGNALGRVEKLQSLGAKAKRKMPPLPGHSDTDDSVESMN